MFDIISFLTQQFFNVFNFLDSIVIFESLTLFKLILVIILFMIIFKFLGGKKNG